MCRSLRDGGQRCACETRKRFEAADPDTPEWDDAIAEHASTETGYKEMNELAVNAILDRDDEDLSARIWTAMQRGKARAQANREAKRVMDDMAGDEEAPRYIDADWYQRLTRQQRRELAEQGTVTVLDSQGNPTALVPGVFDDNADYVYTNGQCLAFAAALSKQTGWPIVAVRDDLDDTTPDGAAFLNVRHAYVQAPDGTLLDIRGEQGTLDDVLDADSTFSDEPVEPVTFSTARDALAHFDGHVQKQAPVVAEPFAAAVLATYKAGGYSSDTEFNYAALAPRDAKALLDVGIQRRYTLGDCGILAHHLAETNGWGVCVVGAYETEEYDDDHTYYGVENLTHAYAVRPDGMLVDVMGVHPPDTAQRLATEPFARDGGASVHMYPDAATADRVWNHEQWYDDEPDGEDPVEFAGHVARLVTVAYGT